MAALHAATASIQRELDTLEGAVAMVRDSWSGSARTAYDDAQRQWTTAMQSMNAALATADTAAVASGEALSAAEASAISLWR